MPYDSGLSAYANTAALQATVLSFFVRPSIYDCLHVVLWKLLAPRTRMVCWQEDFKGCHLCWHQHRKTVCTNKFDKDKDLCGTSYCIKCAPPHTMAAVSKYHIKFCQARHPSTSAASISRLRCCLPAGQLGGALIIWTCA